MRIFVLAALAALSGAICSTQALAEGDAVLGKKVFAKCMACHDAKAEKDKVGPHLVGIFGRTAGTLESFAKKYSPAMVEAGAAGLVWDEVTIAEYVKNPKERIPGNKMAFAGLKKDDEIANLIAYLKADPKP
jgi:cytochrome c